jgi:hypothetical protein
MAMPRFLLSVALATSLFAAPVFAQCLPDTVLCSNYGYGTPTVTADSSQSCVGSWTASQSCFGACYDLPLGQLAILGGGTIAPWWNHASSQDSYQLIGPQTDTPITFVAQVRIQGSLSSSAYGSASLQANAEPAQIVDFAGGGSPLNDTLSVTLEYRSGDSFVLRGTLSAGGPAYQTADVRSRLQFVGLHGGWSIASCQGYDVPVPAMPTTWGWLRARYR